MSFARYLTLFAAVLTLACGGDPATPAAANRLGRFQLLRINGKPLPGFVTEGSAARIDFLRGAVHLNPDGRFVDSTEARITPRSGSVRFNTDVATGSYRLSHDTVFFDSDRVNERYFMVYATEQSLLQELAGSILLYTR